MNDFSYFEIGASLVKAPTSNKRPQSFKIKKVPWVFIRGSTVGKNYLVIANELHAITHEALKLNSFKLIFQRYVRVFSEVFSDY